MKKGERFGRLTFLGTTERKEKRYWGDFLCDCGTEKKIRIDQVKSGAVVSCGCKHREKKNSFGLSESDYKKVYNAWWNMKNRCTNPKSSRFYTYGERGIGLCKEWEDPKAFISWAVKNGWKPGLTVERNDVNKGYSPENCSIIPYKKQAQNKTTNIRITINGEEKCLSEWCRILNFPFKRAWKRYHVYGYRDIETIFYEGDLRGRSVS